MKSARKWRRSERADSTFRVVAWRGEAMAMAMVTATVPAPLLARCSCASSVCEELSGKGVLGTYEDIPRPLI